MKWKKLRTGSFQLGDAKVYCVPTIGWFLEYDRSQIGTYSNCDDAMSAGERMVERLSAAPRKRRNSRKAVAP